MIEKEGNKTIVSGLVENHVVDTFGGNYTYELQVGYDSIDSIVRSYEGDKVRITIEVISDTTEENSEESYEEEGW